MLLLSLISLLVITSCSAMEKEILDEEDFEIIEHECSAIQEETLDFEIVEHEENSKPLILSTRYYPGASYFIVHGEHKCEKWVCGTRSTIEHQDCPELEQQHKNLCDWSLLINKCQPKRTPISFYNRKHAKLKEDWAEGNFTGLSLWAQEKLDPQSLPLAYTASILYSPNNGRRSICFKNADNTILCLMPYQGSTQLDDPQLRYFSSTADLSQLKKITDETERGERGDDAFLGLLYRWMPFKLFNYFEKSPPE